MVDISHTFGERLRSAILRRAGGAPSVNDLAKACGVSYQAVKKWMDADTPKIDALNAMAAAKFLGVSYEWLLTGKGPETESGWAQATTTALSTGEKINEYAAQPMASNVVESLSAFLEQLNPVLKPSALKIINLIIDGEIKNENAANLLDGMLAMSAAVAPQSKQSKAG